MNRVPALDGIRGVAILVVMTIHCTMWLKTDTFSALIFKTLTAGSWGTISIDLFFVLSGYLITSILLGIQGRRNWLRHFYFRRANRILPLYIVVLTVCFYVLPLLPVSGARGFLPLQGYQYSFWSFLANYHTKVFVIPYAHFWSICLETHFYILWPLMIYLFKGRMLLRICLAVIMGVTLMRWASLLDGVRPIAIYIMTHTRMDAPFYGALVAILAYRQGGLAQYRAFARKYAWMLAVPVFVIAGHSNNLFTHSQVMIGFNLNGVFFALIMVLALTGSERDPMVRVLSSRVLRAAGKYSYGAYLVHMPFIYLISLLIVGVPANQAVAHVNSPIGWTVVLWCLTMISSFVTGFLTWHLIEKHFLRMSFYRFRLESKTS